MGFPGEREDDFEETLNLLLRYRPQYVLASKYMEPAQAPSSILSDKVKDRVAFERLRKTEERLVQAGIICNCDGSQLSKSRLERIHED